MRESAEQMPHLTQTVLSVSLPFARHKNDRRQSHTCERREEDSDQAEEDIRRAHLGFVVVDSSCFSGSESSSDGI